jgi:hypothetical protein
MMMLDFQRHPVKIAHINVRTEMHGDEEVTAVDLKLTFDVPNLVLDKLSPTLRPSLYEAANDPDMLGPDAMHLPHLKNPELGTLRWAGEYEPVSLHLHTSPSVTQQSFFRRRCARPHGIRGCFPAESDRPPFTVVRRVAHQFGASPRINCVHPLFRRPPAYAAPPWHIPCVKIPHDAAAP